MERVCKQCLQHKDITEYIKYPSRAKDKATGRKTGHHTICRACYNLNCTVNRYYTRKQNGYTLSAAQEKVLVDMAELYKISAEHGGDPHGAYAAAVLGKEKKVGVDVMNGRKRWSQSIQDMIGSINRGAAAMSEDDESKLVLAKSMLLATGDDAMTWQKAKKIVDMCGDLMEATITNTRMLLYEEAAEVKRLFDMYLTDQEFEVTTEGTSILDYVYGTEEDM